jgi:hypothetical protein
VQFELTGWLHFAIWIMYVKNNPGSLRDTEIWFLLLNYISYILYNQKVLHYLKKKGCFHNIRNNTPQSNAYTFNDRLYWLIGQADVNQVILCAWKTYFDGLSGKRRYEFLSTVALT